ncbi:MAG TPA: hypothetical protein VHB97_16845, partial [Polyangia bacterium]|nr:hypothetical protein [Polyangia bacterium]
PPLPTHAAWTPAPRATIFTHTTMTARPSFGQIAVRAARSDGHIVGLRAGSTPTNGGFGRGPAVLGASHTFGGSGHAFGGGGFGRSGSIGRAGGGSFGGG